MAGDTLGTPKYAPTIEKSTDVIEIISGSSIIRESFDDCQRCHFAV